MKIDYELGCYLFIIVMAITFCIIGLVTGNGGFIEAVQNIHF